MSLPLKDTDSKYLTQLKKTISELTYKEQAVFFLNAFWAEHSESAPDVWEFVKRFVALDHQNEEEGHALDEFQVWVCCVLCVVGLMCYHATFCHTSISTHTNHKRPIDF